MNTYTDILSISIRKVNPEMYFLNVITKKDLSKLFKADSKFKIY